MPVPLHPPHSLIPRLSPKRQRHGESLGTRLPSSPLYPACHATIPRMPHHCTLHDIPFLPLYPACHSPDHHCIWCATPFTSHPSRYWPQIDDALRSAAYSRGVNVRVMGSYWNHTLPDMLKFLRSLADMSGTGSFQGTIETVSVPYLSIFLSV